MSKSSGSRGFGRRTGTVTVIEQKVHRSSARNARMAFIIIAVTVGLVALVVAKQHMHPILAVFVAAPIAFIAGGIAWTLVRIWPVLRLIWWWAFEIILIVSTAWGWTALAAHTAAPLTLGILAVLVGVPTLVGPVRRRVTALAWCVIVRHRLRVCFAQFIVANKSGSLPLIGWALPTPVGERVMVTLRPGLSLPYLQGQLDKIAVACHAKSALVEQPGDNAARVRFDIKRREVLTSDVSSPLPARVDPNTPVADKKPATIIGGLDLPDVPDDPHPLATAAKSATSTNGKKPPASSVAADDGDDITDWI
jgi:hypothetical protein